MNPGTSSGDSAAAGELYQLFLEIRELSPEARERSLSELFVRHPTLARELAELLRADETSSGFLESPALAGELAWRDVVAGDSGQFMPERIGRYKLLGILGQGGMGVVYRAEQDTPRRTVALKVLRSSLATPRRLRRFEHEAELLARLQHPGIAQVYEAGTAESDGRTRAFIAMELVRGEDLRAHVKRHAPGNGPRLALLIRMAEAVAHAHTKGVVHRDLKPENVLVDESGAPRIVDFGVARLIGSDSDLATLHTEEGRLVGTPWYMSPEQLSGDPDAADTRSDVYALGVIGFELWSGRLPYRLEEKPLVEVARVITDEQPARLRELAPSVPADLETVLAKCLEKEPARRYGSASDLAADLVRVQRSEPIAARPPSGVYLLRRFVRRNRGLATGIALAALALVLGATGFAFQAARAARERDGALEARELAQRRFGEAQRARDRALEAEELARQLSEERARERDRAVSAERLAEQRLEETARERDKFEASSSFLQRLLGSVDPAAEGKDVRVSEVLARGSQDLTGTFPGDPRAEADLRRTLGASYRALGLPEEALAELRTALELLEGAGAEPPGLDEARSDVALLLNDLGQREEAETLFRGTLEHQRATLGPRTLEALTTANNLAVLLRRQGELAEAEQLLREVVSGTGELARMEPLAREAPAGETLARLSAAARRHLASLLQDRGDLAGARELLGEALDDARAAFGERDLEFLSVLNDLATLEASLGQLESAIGHLEESLAGQSELLPPEHPNILTLQNNLGTLIMRAGRVEEGEALLWTALEGRRAVLGPENPATLTTANNLAGAWIELGRLEEAEALLREVIAAQERTLPPGHWMPDASSAKLARCLFRQGRLAEARELLETSYAGLQAALGPASEKTRSARELLIQVAELQGDAERAGELRSSE